MYKCEICEKEISFELKMFCFDTADSHSFCPYHLDKYNTFKFILLSHVLYNFEKEWFYVEENPNE